MAPSAAVPTFPVLLDLYKAWSVVPPDWALLGLCIYCASTFHELRRYFLAHFWTTFLYAFGGGLSTALLIMRPDRAPVSILSDGRLGLMWAATWWVMNYFPYQIPAKIHSLWPVKMVTLMCVAYCKDKLIIERVNLACELYPGTIVGPLVLGTLAGCAGTIICDSIRQAQGILRRPHELSVPSFSWRSAFLPCCFYFFAAKYPTTAFLLPEEAVAVLLTLLVGHSLLSSLTGMDLDYLQPLLNAGLTLLNIPIPRSSPAASAAKQQVKASVSAPECSRAAAPAPARATAAAQQPAQHTSLNGTSNGSSGSNSRDQNGKAAATLRTANGTSHLVKESALSKQHSKASDEVDAPAVVAVGPTVNGVAKDGVAKAPKKAKPVAQPGWTQVLRKGKKE